MKDTKRWPRFTLTITMEVAAPCADAAEAVAEEYVTRMRNDNGESREPYVGDDWDAGARRHGPTEPAYVVAAYHRLVR